MSGPQFCEGEAGQVMERADIVSEGFFAGLRLELYDLASDPMETTNMAGGQEVTFYWMNKNDWW